MASDAAIPNLQNGSVAESSWSAQGSISYEAQPATTSLSGHETVVTPWLQGLAEALPFPAAPSPDASIVPDILRWRAKATRINAEAIPAGSINELSSLARAEQDLNFRWGVNKIRIYYDLRNEYHHLLTCRQRGEPWKPVTPVVREAMVTAGGHLRDGLDVVHENGEGLKELLAKIEEELFVCLERSMDLRWRGMVLCRSQGRHGRRRTPGDH